MGVETHANVSLFPLQPQAFVVFNGFVWDWTGILGAAFPIPHSALVPVAGKGKGHIRKLENDWWSTTEANHPQFMSPVMTVSRQGTKFEK
jgi:hypothetical protein